MRSRSRPGRAFRRLWPWLVGVAIVAFIISRVPFEAFRSALAHGPHLALVAVNVVLILVILGVDSASTWIGLLAIQMRRPFAHVMAGRGTTYVLFLLNYALGQGGFGYYLHRSGTSAKRAVGATLFLIGTNLATLLVVTAAAWTLRGAHAAHEAMWWTLVLGCGAFLVYLLVLALSPAFIARREILAILFDAGVRGHALAMLGRLPHVAVLVLGHWVAMRAWGIEIPFVVGLTLMPAVVVASALPISPSGLGTTQVAMIYFFSDYAPGATPDERAAAVLAFSIVYFVYGVLSALAVGLACTPFAKRLASARTEETPLVPDAASGG